MDEITSLPVSALRESPFNPRKTYDPEALQKLAWTIECDGVLQPLEVRPIPGQFDYPDATERYEIVFGHRRFRAARLAKLEYVPCIVRERDDEAARRVQLVENIQRDEVSPLEQAQALRLLMDEHHMKAEDVGAHVGKSRAWVYAQLRLLNLQPGLQAEVEQGRMTSEVAIQVAALHPKLQERAAEALQVKAYKDGSMQATGEYRSSRDSKALLQREFFCDLQGVAFDRSDVWLVPGRPSCDTCPYCTGRDPDLTERYGPDLCTDSACFEAKEHAHEDAQIDAQIAEWRAAGGRVIEGDEARQIAPEGWPKTGYKVVQATIIAYADGPVRLPDVVKEMVLPPPSVLVVGVLDNGRRRLTEAMADSDVELVRDWYKAQRQAPKSDDDEPEVQLTPEQEAVSDPRVWPVIERQIMRQAIASPERTLDELRRVAHTMCDCCYDLDESVVDAFGWRAEIDAWLESSDGSISEEDWLHWRIEQMTADEIGRLVVVLAIAQAPVKGKLVDSHDEKLDLCRTYGVDPLDPERAEALPTPSTAARAAEEAPADGPKPKAKKRATKAAHAADMELDLEGGHMSRLPAASVKDEPADAGDEMNHEPASPAGEVVA